jgi:SAM-dependent methyltransferase
MYAAQAWLTAIWPVVRAGLPPPPARVVEIGCGSSGGFVPMLRAAGYETIGVDPDAPEGADFRRVEFEHAGPLGAADAVVASTSLHHVAVPGEVVGRIEETLERGGALIVIEWDWEAFDEPTADWCFQRLGPDEDAGWLHRRRDEWAASGQPWSSYLREWARAERIHAPQTLLDLLDDRFQRRHLARGPYFFADLPGTSAEEELAAIAAGTIRATRIDYVGTLLR